MSFKAMAWAASVKTQTPIQKLILLMLSDKANDEGFCWPKMQTIADDCCMTRRCVLENVKKLAALGFIQVEHRTVESEEGGLVNISNIYRVQVGKAPLGVVNDVQGGSEYGSLGVVNDVHNKNLSVEPIKEPINNDGFSEFWETYPRKDNKERAKKAWSALQKTTPTDLEVITNHIKKRISSGSWKLDQKQYIPNPEAFINGKRWEDEIIIPQRPVIAPVVRSEPTLPDAKYFVHKE